MKPFRYLNNARGAVAPLVAIMLVVIIVCVAVVVDLGHIHNVKVQLQRAVDAAALAGANELPDEDAAVSAAEAVAAENHVDQEEVIIDPDTDIVLGTWNEEIIPGETAADRFDETGTPPNAVKVIASRAVDHVFFFFLPSTTISADAIALSSPVQPTLPIAVTSCIPTGGEEVLGILSPGATVCDIAFYSFGSASTDTAAWTSLTVSNANSNNLDKFFATDDGQINIEGIRFFNKIVYGEPDEPHDGIEYQSIANDRRCTTDDNLVTVKNFDNLSGITTNITCGLGEDFSENAPATPLDPLNYSPLPRWYNTEEFEYIWAQRVGENLLGEDLLILQPQENLSESYDNTNYKDRMKDLKEASASGMGYDTYNGLHPLAQVPNEFPKDDRFDRYIPKVSGPDAYMPDFKQPLLEAGYPEVWLIEGVTETLTQFTKVVAQGDIFKSFFRGVNEPLDPDSSATSGGEGETVRLTVPIIFTGKCNEAQYNKPGIYVGLADLLLTRMWDKGGNACFYNGGDSVDISLTCPPPPGKLGKFGPRKQDYQLPSLSGGGQTGQILSASGFSNKAFEGLIGIPNKGADLDAGIKRIYLVE